MDIIIGTKEKAKIDRSNFSNYINRQPESATLRVSNQKSFIDRQGKEITDIDQSLGVNYLSTLRENTDILLISNANALSPRSPMSAREADNHDNVMIGEVVNPIMRRSK